MITKNNKILVESFKHLHSILLRIRTHLIWKIRNVCEFILDKTEWVDEEYFWSSSLIKLKDIKDNKDDFILFDDVRLNPSWMNEFLRDYKFKELDFEELIYYTFFFIEPKEFEKLEGFKNVIDVLKTPIPKQ